MTISMLITVMFCCNTMNFLKKYYSDITWVPWQPKSMSSFLKDTHKKKPIISMVKNIFCWSKNLWPARYPTFWGPSDACISKWNGLTSSGGLIGTGDGLLTVVCGAKPLQESMLIFVKEALVIKDQLNLNKNITVFIQENAFKNYKFDPFCLCDLDVWWITFQRILLLVN